MKTDHAFVAVEGVPYAADRLFEYAVPDRLCGLVEPGCVVTVPFGAGNRTHRGVVWRTGAPETERVKDISAVSDVACVADKTSLRLAAFLHEKVFCTYFDAVKTVLAPGLFGSPDRYYAYVEEPDEDLKAYFDANGNNVERRKLLHDLTPAQVTRVLRAVREAKMVETLRPAGAVRERVVRFAALTDDADGYRADAPEKHARVLDILSKGPRPAADVLREAGVTQSVLQTLRKKGVVTLTDTAVGRDPLAGRAEAECAPLCLSEDQKKALSEISANLGTGKSHLLYGVTGSGKTQVYMALMDEVLARGQRVLVLVPEISITLQTLDVFCRRYGRDVAVLHSGLSAGERYDEWRRVERGDCRIVIGTRSAVFAPVKELGLIIADEEQEHTYLSEMAPRYNALEVAAFRAREQNILFLCGSATPSFERFRAAKEGRMGYSVLTKRFNEKPLPKTLVVDMNRELRDGNTSLLSRDLAREMNENLRRGEQTVLFMNRRGYSSFVSCPACRHAFVCPSCGIALTYHRTDKALVCHYCGHREPAPDVCPACGAPTLKYSGAGTQKVEAELLNAFAGLRVLRMDADTVGRKDARDEMLCAFRRHDYDVLLGTQMITKGLDFPDVTLVGVLMADSLLYSSDFRAYEKTFSVITQVVGRAGRAEKEGRAVVQTFSPAHTVLGFAFEQDYEGFYAQESVLRKTLTYPPFCDVCQVLFLAETVSRAYDAAEAWIAAIAEAVGDKGAFAGVLVSIIRPRETAVPMDHGKHRVRVLVKCRDDSRTRALFASVFRAFVKEQKDVITDMTMNPSVIV